MFYIFSEVNKMRMWKVDVKKMCNKHLLGEHVELHMFVGTILKNKSLNGYVEKGLIETSYIVRRHQELAAEMRRRGMRHQSKLPDFEVDDIGEIDVEANEIELRRRCKNCKF